MIVKMLVAAAKAVLEPVHHNKTGALAGFVAGAVLGVVGAVVIHLIASPDATLTETALGLGSLFAVLGAAFVAQWTYHASGTDDPRVIEIPRPKRKC
jgi:uncharacterized membrane protein YeaQ/YmgE (transglycosylase-associated protein family)